MKTIVSYVLQPAAPSGVPVFGTDELFPVHRVYCVGRNYVDHALEMGETGREAPFFFMKPTDAVVAISYDSIGRIPYPSKTTSFHHEVELVVAIGRRGVNVDIKEAREMVWGYAIGLDMTRRDMQQEAKDKRRPWDTAKGFDRSAPIGPIHPIAKTGPLAAGAIWLSVNGERRQSSDLSKLIWTVAETIEHLSTFFELQPGDLIFTGTPEGVGAVKGGDLMVCGIEALGTLQVQVE